MGKMLRKNFMAGWMVVVWLALATLTTIPCVAQHNDFQRAQNRQGQNHPQGHAGDWLRHYQGMTPGERERALQNDPGFRRLAPEQQQLLRQRLQHFFSLPPRQQQLMLNRMETWEHLTPGQKQEARQVFGH